MRRNFIIAAVVLAVMCVLAAAMSENFLIGLLGILLIPLVLTFDICFYALPLTVVVLIILSVLQFITRDYKKFDKAFMIFIMIFVFGWLNLVTENAISKTGYFMQDGIIKIYILIIGLSLIGAVVSYISKKKDTRYYLPIIFLMFGFTIYYCFFRGV